MINVSLFASAIRYKLWPDFLGSLYGTSVNYEVVFSGNASYSPPDNGVFKYIKTGNIKPAQCYEIARRACTGECIVWVADDCAFKGNIIGEAYKYWKAKNNPKLILSLQTEESGEWQDMTSHTLLGPGSPIMAPIALMSREFLNELGGLDCRYICGQYENDLIMRAYQAGAVVEVFGDRSKYVEIDHKNKSILCGEIASKEEFDGRPFATGYGIDRWVLESSWTKMDEVRLFIAIGKYKDKYIPALEYMNILEKRADEFRPYVNDEILTKSQSNKGKWE